MIWRACAAWKARRRSRSTASASSAAATPTRWRAEAASDLRGRLAALWQAGLTAQDRQAWRPHVTIQNKANPAEARALHTQLMQGFAPMAGTATGVALWHYLGGPWEPAASVPFGG